MFYSCHSSTMVYLPLSWCWIYSPADQTKPAWHTNLPPLDLPDLPTHMTNPLDQPTWPNHLTWPAHLTWFTYLFYPPDIAIGILVSFAILVINIQQQLIRNYNLWCTIHLLPPLWLGMGSGVLFVLFMCFWTHQTGATVSMSLMEVFWTQTHRKCFV